MTEKALALGADPLAPDWQGRAALWHAASTPSLVQLIMDSQAWPTEGFNAGGALHRACELGHVESARIMLAHGSNLLDVKHTRSPLHAACRGGHVECVKMLLERGADPNVVGAPRRET